MVKDEEFKGLGPLYNMLGRLHNLLEDNDWSSTVINGQVGYWYKQLDDGSHLQVSGTLEAAIIEGELQCSKLANTADSDI